LFVVLGIGEVQVEYALGVVAQFFEPQFVVRQVHDIERFFGGRHALEVGNDRLGAVGGGHVGTAAVIVFGDIHLVAGNGVNQPCEPFARIGSITAVGVAAQQFVERFVRFAQALGVAFGRVLPGESAKGRAGGRKGDQPLEIQHVIAAGVIGVLLLEAVDSGQSLFGLFVFPVDVGLIDERLLCVGAEGVT